MKNLQSAKSTIQKNKKVIVETFHVKRIGIFGSTVRGEDNVHSDVDILVEFSKPVGFFTFFDLEEFLKKELGKPVDLVTKNALKPQIGKRILREVVYV